MRALRCFDKTSFSITEAMLASRWNKSYDVVNALDLIPVNGGIASQYPDAPFRQQFLIQCSHEWEKLLNESRRSARWLAHFPPYSLNFSERDILSGYIAIQDGLVQRIAELDFNVVHLLRKRRVADQRKNEIIQVLHSMALRHGHDFVFVEGGKDGGYRRFWNRFGTRQSCLRLRLSSICGRNR
jgi:hypothetical protein